MDENRWLNGTDVTHLLLYLQVQLRAARSKAGRRKLRLFAAACCRAVAHLLPGERARAGIEAVEQFAEGALGLDQADALRASMMAERRARMQPPREAGIAEADRQADNFASLTVWHALAGETVRAARDAARLVVPALVGHWSSPASGPQADPQPLARRQELRRQALAVVAGFLRDVIGNPFRPVALRREWLAWHDGTLPRVAQAIYDDRAFDRLPVLADALQDAACDAPDLIDHCRGPGPHVRGCWAVDLLLGKGWSR